MTLKIYQLPIEHPLKFRGRVKFFAPMKDYTEVYDSTIEDTFKNTLWESHINDGVDCVLEYVYTLFNIGNVNGFNGQSLSVSDIVEIDGIKYFVDSIGFKKYIG